MSSTSTASKHFISLDQAKKMTKKARHDKKKVLGKDYQNKDIIPVCETFDRESFDRLLAQPGCVGVRAYYAMDDELGLHLIFVGVNEKNEDMIPAVETTAMRLESTTASTTQESDTVIIENGNKCPANCPPPSALNSDI